MHNLTFTVHQFDQWEQILWMYLKVNVVKWDTALLVFMQLHMFVMISWINMFYLYDRNNGSETETSLIYQLDVCFFRYVGICGVGVNVAT